MMILYFNDYLNCLFIWSMYSNTGVNTEVLTIDAVTAEKTAASVSHVEIVLSSLNTVCTVL